jgi:hypothetical protein
VRAAKVEEDVEVVALGAGVVRVAKQRHGVLCWFFLVLFVVWTSVDGGARATGPPPPPCYLITRNTKERTGAFVLTQAGSCSSCLSGLEATAMIRV